MLFRGALFCSAVEIKCKRCGAVRLFAVDSNERARRFLSFTFIIGSDERILDVSNGVAMVGYERAELVGKPLADIFPLVRDAPAHKRTLGDTSYSIRNNILLLGDKSSLQTQSYFVPVEHNEKSASYRMFNIIEGP